MRTSILIILSLLTICTKAQIALRVFAETKDRGAVIYAENKEFFPVSINLVLDMNNMVFSEKDKSLFVVPPKSDKYKIGEVSIDKPGSGYSYKYRYQSAMGDAGISSYDTNFVYDLPFSKGASFKLAQGYNGSSSHRGENALDFTMPVGTDILAAREGIVVQVLQSNTASCPEEECKKYNNYIIVMHADGTYAQYTHIKYNGAKVKAGDKVSKGMVIASSGNVGYTTGPHLHFVCFLGTLNGWKTIETRFRINSGDNITQLTEGETYTRNY